jgi:hypothetical protein
MLPAKKMLVAFVPTDVAEGFIRLAQVQTRDPRELARLLPPSPRWRRSLRVRGVNQRLHFGRWHFVATVVSQRLVSFGRIDGRVVG